MEMWMVKKLFPPPQPSTQPLFYPRAEVATFQMMTEAGLKHGE